MYLIGALFSVLIVAVACGSTVQDLRSTIEATPTITTDGPAPPQTTPAPPSQAVATPAPVLEPAAAVPPKTGVLQHARGGWHTATLFEDGRVLVAGGLDQPFVLQSEMETLKSAETFDPATGSWTRAASMGLSRGGHTASLLDEGTVLVAGGALGGIGGIGVGRQGFLRSTMEVYDALEDSWARSGKLDAGRVLVAGGFRQDRGPPTTDSVEVYDPSRGTWSSTGSLAEKRLFHTLTLLQDGRVLAVGGMPSFGSGATGVEVAEVYDPSDGTWTEAGSLQEVRRWHTATLLEDGTVLIAGGMIGELESLQSAEIYDPASGWSPVGSMSEARALHTATRLPDGRVLVVGGLRDQGSAEFGLYVSGPPLASAEVYNPSSGTWSPVESMSEKRSYHAAVLLEDGRVLVIGGTGEGQLMLDSTELFDPSTGTWSAPGAER